MTIHNDLHEEVQAVSGELSGAGNAEEDTLPLEHETPETWESIGQCSHCGNTYDKVFEVAWGTELYTFDSFECAIHMLAPKCERCKCRIIGHGLESNGSMFCCANCAREVGEQGLRDRADKPGALDSLETDEDIPQAS